MIGAWAMIMDTPKPRKTPWTGLRAVGAGPRRVGRRRARSARRRPARRCPRDSAAALNRRSPSARDHAAADVVAQQPQRHEQTAEAEEPIPTAGTVAPRVAATASSEPSPQQGGGPRVAHGELRQLGALRGDGDDEAGQQRV